MQRQVREQRALSGPAKRNRPTVNNKLERPKDPELHQWVVSPPSCFCNSPVTAFDEGVGMTRLLFLLAAAAMPLTASAGSVRIDVGRGPCCIVFAQGGIWVGNHRDVSVQRIDPLTNRAANPIVIAKPAGATGGGSNLSALVTNGKALFVLDGGMLERSV